MSQFTDNVEMLEDLARTHGANGNIPFQNMPWKPAAIWDYIGDLVRWFILAVTILIPCTIASCLFIIWTYTWIPLP